MALGQMRERVRFTRTVKTRRADGGYDTVQQSVCERWASVKPMSARENEQAGRLAGRTTYVVTIRRTEGLSTEDTIVWLSNGNTPLNIRELPLPQVRNHFMEIQAEAGAVL